MAVYTEVSDEALVEYLNQHELGSLLSLKGIAGGVENSNFLLHVEKGTFILTLYEKRVAKKDLPFFIGLMDTEGVKLEFSDDAVKRIAEIAWQVNESTENIGARRLHTIMERLLEEISFTATDRAGEKIRIDADTVREQVGDLAKDADLSKFIL